MLKKVVFVAALALSFSAVVDAECVKWRCWYGLDTAECEQSGIGTKSVTCEVRERCTWVCSPGCSWTCEPNCYYPDPCLDA